MNIRGSNAELSDSHPVKSPSLSSKRFDNTVLICQNARLGQVVLTTLHANGIKPWLIVDPTTASSLQSSWLIRGVLMAKPNLAGHVNQIVDAINEQKSKTGIPLVIASDVEGMLILASERDRLPTIFPQSNVQTLLQLNSKKSFGQLCSKLDLPTPATLFPSMRSDIDLVEVEQLGYPIVVKPISESSSVGFRIIHSRNALVNLLIENDEYRRFSNIIIQRFIEGRDIGMSLFVREGEVIAGATFKCGLNDATEISPMPDFFEMGRKICEATRYTGVVNFDGRMTADGKIYLFECNPRFFARLSALRICGLDFLRMGLLEKPTTAPTASGNYYARMDAITPRGIKRLMTGQWPVSRLYRGCVEALHDPVPLLKRRLGADALRR